MKLVKPASLFFRFCFVAFKFSQIIIVWLSNLAKDGASQKAKDDTSKYQIIFVWLSNL